MPRHEKDRESTISLWRSLDEALMAETLTLEIPDAIYRRLVDTARATNRPLEEIVLRVFEVGSPPSWTDAPEPFQADLAALDQLDNESLWAIPRSTSRSPS